MALGLVRVDSLQALRPADIGFDSNPADEVLGRLRIPTSSSIVDRIFDALVTGMWILFFSNVLSMLNPAF
jgi:hypothetical protein